MAVINLTVRAEQPIATSRKLLEQFVALNNSADNLVAKFSIISRSSRTVFAREIPTHLGILNSRLIATTKLADALAVSIGRVAGFGAGISSIGSGGVVRGGSGVAGNRPRDARGRFISTGSRVFGGVPGRIDVNVGDRTLDRQEQTRLRVADRQADRRERLQRSRLETQQRGRLDIVDRQQQGRFNVVDRQQTGRLRVVDRQQQGRLDAVNRQQAGRLNLFDRQQQGRLDAINRQAEIRAGLQAERLEARRISDERRQANINRTNRNRRISRGLYSAGRLGGRIGGGVGGLLGSISPLGFSTAGIVGTVALGGLIASTYVGGRFEDELSRITAIRNLSGGDLSNLVGNTRRIASTSRFTPTQSLEAIENLVRSGFSTSRATSSLSSIIPLALLNRGQSLAQTSNILLDLYARYPNELATNEGLARSSDLTIGALATSRLTPQSLQSNLRYLRRTPNFGNSDLAGSLAFQSRLAGLGIFGNSNFRQYSRGLSTSYFNLDDFGRSFRLGENAFRDNRGRRRNVVESEYIVAGALAREIIRTGGEITPESYAIAQRTLGRTDLQLGSTLALATQLSRNPIIRNGGSGLDVARADRARLIRQSEGAGQNVLNARNSTIFGAFNLLGSAFEDFAISTIQQPNGRSTEFSNVLSNGVQFIASIVNGIATGNYDFTNARTADRTRRAVRFNNEFGQLDPDRLNQAFYNGQIVRRSDGSVITSDRIASINQILPNLTQEERRRIFNRLGRLPVSNNELNERVAEVQLDRSNQIRNQGQIRSDSLQARNRTIQNILDGVGGFGPQRFGNSLGIGSIPITDIQRQQLQQELNENRFERNNIRTNILGEGDAVQTETQQRLSAVRELERGPQTVASLTQAISVSNVGILNELSLIRRDGIRAVEIIRSEDA